MEPWQNDPIAPTTSGQAAEPWQNDPVVPAPKLPDTSGVQQMAKDNLAANDNKETPEGGEAKPAPTPAQKLDTALGMPVSSAIGNKDNDVEFTPAMRAHLTDAYAKGTAFDSGDWMQSVLHPFLANVGKAETDIIKDIFNPSGGPTGMNAEQYQEWYKNQPKQGYLAQLGEDTSFLSGAAMMPISPLFSIGSATAQEVAKEAYEPEEWAVMSPEEKQKILNVASASGQAVGGVLGAAAPLLHIPTESVRDIVARKLNKKPDQVTSQDIAQAIRMGFENKAPKAQDFKDTAAVMLGHENAETGAQTLLNVYSETGVAPAQVHEDAARVPQIAADIAAGKIPDAYQHLLPPPEQLTHRQVVEKAVAEGQPVPDHVLAQYPDLAAKAKYEEHKNMVTMPVYSEGGSVKAPIPTETVKPSELTLDPQRFQYKESNDKGVTGALAGVNKWEPLLANNITVWRGKDGKTYIVNGHQRYDLASRAEAGGQDVNMQAHVLKESDGYTAEDARVLGAYQNIAEGSGTALDAAEILRSGELPSKMQLPELPPNSQLVKQARGLEALSPEAYGMVKNGLIEPSYAAEVGRYLTDAKEQMAAMEVLAKKPPANVQQANIMVQDIKNSGFATETQTGLFGEEQIAQSIFYERARILDNVLKQLGQMKNAFGTAVRQEGALSEAGNVLIKKANEKAKEANEKLIQTLKADATRKGELSDALSAAARDLKAGKPLTDVAKQFLTAARGLAGREGRPLIQPGATAGGGQSAQPKQAELVSAERTGEQLTAANEGRLKPSVAQAGDTGPLFGDHGQNELFQRAPEPAPTFYSALQRNLESLPQGKGSAEQWNGIIKNLTGKGVKQEEIDWSGVQDWLKEQKGAVSKQQVMDYLKANALDVQEVVRGNAFQQSDENLLADLEDRSPDQVTESGMPPTKFGVWQLPGGENYRELLMTLPQEGKSEVELINERDEAKKAYKELESRKNNGENIQQGEVREAYNRLIDTEVELQRFMGERGNTAPVFRSGHFTEPNVIAHLRFNERIDADGKKVMMIEEVQSDWHQKGKKTGYQNDDVKAAEAKYQAAREKLMSLQENFRDWLKENDNLGFDFPAQAVNAIRAHDDFAQRWDIKGEGLEKANEFRDAYAAMQDAEKGIRRDRVPDAPFKTTWPELAFKRALRYAAENGFDKVAWTTGEQQAARYNLSKQVDRILYNPETHELLADTPNQTRAIEKIVPPEKLEDYIGKDAARKISEGKAEKDGYIKLAGEDLKVGGEGMKGFYDKILPNTVNKLVKKWGAKVGETKLDMPSSDSIQTAEIYNSMNITPEEWFNLPRAEKDKILNEKLGTVHSIEITPEMRDSVMQGQPLFNRQLAAGEVPEGAIPVAPGVAAVPKELYTEKEAKIVTQVNAEVQRLLGGKAIVKTAERLYATGKQPGEVQGYTQPLKLDDGQVRQLVYLSMRAGDMTASARHEAFHPLWFNLDAAEQAALRAAAEKGNWIGKHNVETRWENLTKDQQLQEAYAEEFSQNRRNDFTNLPQVVRPIFQKIAKIFDAIADVVRQVLGKDVTAQDVFSRVESGEVGQRGTEEGEGAFQAPEGKQPWEMTPEEYARAKLPPDKQLPSFIKDESGALTFKLPENAKAVMNDIKRDVLNFTTPMETGSDRARASAKDFANNLRFTQWNGAHIFNLLTEQFSPAELKGMWEAMDQASVHAQTLEANGMSREEAMQSTEKAGIGHFALPEAQKEIIKAMSDWAQHSYDQAKRLGMVEGEGLPFWTPRMAAVIGEDGRWGKPAPGERPTVNVGRNLVTTAGSLKQRKYLTAAETEAAMKKAFGGEEGEGAMLVRDIRAMPLALTRLNQAIAGRSLVNEIKEMGRNTGADTVSESQGEGYFTLDHPALQTYRPRLKMNDEGKWQVQKDAEGNDLFDKVPIYISKEFEGPLKAVLSQNSSAAYKALMALKGKSMGLIMYSPLIHNAVEWGRALPAMPGKVLTFKVYFEGNRAKNDPVQMKEAIEAGMTPIGSRFFNQDISSIIETPNLTPGRSWTAKLLGGLVGEVNKSAGDGVKAAIDKMGDVWHNTLLWDRIGDLQMGLYTNLRDEGIRKGMEPQAAQAMAAHMANRFAGALPMESMSNMARKMANIAMFSRSFTIGNLGVMKDMVAGLPSDVMAQLTRDIGEPASRAASKIYQRKAIAAFALDIGLMYAGNSLLQSTLDYLKRDKSLGQIGQGYVDRFGKLMKLYQESPWDLLNIPNDLQALSSTSSNEPGKENRILFSRDPKTGTAYYMRMPTGKIGEEFMGWLTSPLDMARKKVSPLVGPLIDTYRNEDYFGHPIYDKEARGLSGAAENVGKVVEHFMKAQIPEDSILSAYNLLTGNSHNESLDYMKATGPLVGVTFSKGYPGGPEAGILASAARRHEAEISTALPQVKEAVDAGDDNKAISIMEKLNMTPREINGLINHYRNPAGKVNPKTIRTFERIGTPEEKELMEEQKKE